MGKLFEGGCLSLSLPLIRKLFLLTLTQGNPTDAIFVTVISRFQKSQIKGFFFKSWVLRSSDGLDPFLYSNLSISFATNTKPKLSKK